MAGREGENQCRAILQCEPGVHGSVQSQLRVPLVAPRALLRLREVFIPEEGKEQSKDPKRLMAREALPRSWHRRISLALRVQRHGTPGFGASRLSAGRTMSRLSHTLSLQLEVCLGLLHSIHISQVSQASTARAGCCASNKRSARRKRCPEERSPSGGIFSPRRSCRWSPHPSGRRLSLELHPMFLKTPIQRPSVQGCRHGRIPTHRASAQRRHSPSGNSTTGWDSTSSSPASHPLTLHTRGPPSLVATSDPPGDAC